MPLPIYRKEATPPSSEIKQIIAIAAGKGGVGKSCVTVNLAHSLQLAGYRVGILDIDIYGPSIRKMLPEDRMPNQKGETIFPALCQGIKMISMAYFRKDFEAAAIRAPIANAIIAQFIKNVAWGQLDYLLVDFPPGTGDVQLTLCQQAALTGAIMVTTPQEVALLDVRKAIHLFKQVHVPIIGIVENMSFYIHPQTHEKIYLFGKDGGERLAEEMSVPLLGKIPLDPELCSCGDRGEVIFHKTDAKEKHSVQAFNRLAEVVIMQLKQDSDQNRECVNHFEVIWKDMNP